MTPHSNTERRIGRSCPRRRIGSHASARARERESAKELAQKDLTREEAATLVDGINNDLDAAYVKIKQLYEGQGWRALGYDTWEDMTRVEIKWRVPRAARPQAVKALTEGIEYACHRGSSRLRSEHHRP
jgi:hypothetical protein